MRKVYIKSQLADNKYALMGLLKEADISRATTIGFNIISRALFNIRINNWSICWLTVMLVVLLPHPAKTDPWFWTQTHCSRLKGFFLRGGTRVADTTRGSGMGYGIIKSISHSREASPHLSWGSEIAQVTSSTPISHTHDPHPPAAPEPHRSSTPPGPWAVFTLFVCQRWSDSSLNLSCHLTPLAPSSSYCRAG